MPSLILDKLIINNLESGSVEQVDDPEIKHCLSGLCASRYFNIITEYAYHYLSTIHYVIKELFCG